MDQTKQTIKMRTWYGANVVAEIKLGSLHRAGFSRAVIPHPPVVNWLLRQKLPNSVKCQLSALHEIGHLQALPFELLYTILLLGIFFLNDKSSNIWMILIIVAGSFAAWEISAEIYTIKSARPNYSTCYQDISLVPRILFWIITATLVVASWIVILI